jgi:hypothetical protein
VRERIVAAGAVLDLPVMWCAAAAASRRLLRILLLRRSCLSAAAGGRSRLRLSDDRGHAAQSVYVLASEARPHRALLGIVWLALTAAAMFALAAGKRATGRALRNRVLETEARAYALSTSNSMLTWGAGRPAGHSAEPKHACAASASGQTPKCLLPSIRSLWK